MKLSRRVGGGISLVSRGNDRTVPPLRIPRACSLSKASGRKKPDMGREAMGGRGMGGKGKGRAEGGRGGGGDGSFSADFRFSPKAVEFGGKKRVSLKFGHPSCAGPAARS